jgi:hypothetical protein
MASLILMLFGRQKSPYVLNGEKINFIDATFSTSLNVDHCRDSRQPADGLTLNACCVQLLHA